MSNEILKQDKEEAEILTDQKYRHSAYSRDFFEKLLAGAEREGGVKALLQKILLAKNSKEKTPEQEKLLAIYSIPDPMSLDNYEDPKPRDIETTISTLKAITDPNSSYGMYEEPSQEKRVEKYAVMRLNKMYEYYRDRAIKAAKIATEAVES
ncbi:MAG: hypothetical protein LBL08_03120 [Candidatus Nomurabacteria bacterium]|jgi:hypothetical protein|nr:hypothetical protein [Candidatus Nomurabacteria bacterium]